MVSVMYVLHGKRREGLGPQDLVAVPIDGSTVLYSMLKTS